MKKKVLMFVTICLFVFLITGCSDSVNGNSEYKYAKGAAEDKSTWLIDRYEYEGSKIPDSYEYLTTKKNETDGTIEFYGYVTEDSDKEYEVDVIVVSKKTGEKIRLVGHYIEVDGNELTEAGKERLMKEIYNTRINE